MYDRILAEFYATPWAILPSKYYAIRAFLHAKAAGEQTPEIKAAAPRKPQLVANAVAVIPVFGVLAKRMNVVMDMSGGTSYDMLLNSMRQAQGDSDVRAIVGEFESPGGAVAGLPEAWEEILKMRGNKPMIAVVNTQAASAAYYVASAFDEIVITTSGSAGSLGCIAEFLNVSKALEMQGVEPTLVVSAVSPNKAAYSGYGPMTEEAHAELKRVVDMEGERFVEAVAKGRGISAKKVRSDFGQGYMVEAKAAVAAGMADRIGTLEDTLRRLLGRNGKPGGGARAEDLPMEVYAATDPAGSDQSAARPAAGESSDDDAADLRRREVELRLAGLGVRP